jgi:predicted DNA-binding transcriptional regulator YafY
MGKNNIFIGDSWLAIYSRNCYKILRGGEPFSLGNVVDLIYENRPKEHPASVSKCDDYKGLIKAVSEVCKLIEARVGKGAIIKTGNNRERIYQYVGNIDDPLVDLANEKTVNDLRNFWQFCKRSNGIFPMPILEHYFKDNEDLERIKSSTLKSNVIISASLNSELKNIELLPILFDAIQRKNVLSISYKPYNAVEAEDIIIHPHLLKEYNGRWFLFGYAVNKDPHICHNLALDRIVDKPIVQADFEYIPAEKDFYTKYFNERVGVSQSKYSEPTEIRLRVHDNYIFSLIETKKIHTSQITIEPFGVHDDGTYGEFSVTIALNNEFIGRILQLGDGIEVTSPISIRNIFKERVQKIAELYSRGPNS